ncbi:MAG: multidrug efflux RND transporter permease subunit [Candidatus Anammoximicrobium sp.]|nr:multidrug efflux RND transporter permease subunit [Candidatus Anammoximicrobium sp.]
MFSQFFIERPILASVPSIMITLIGLAALFMLPVAQYPEVTPPTVQVTCTYPGASAEVLADTVAAPIEQQVNGVEDMLYMSSQSSSDGSYTLTVTFKVGTNLNMAQVLVQNRVAMALPSLPDVVKQVGVVTKKRSPDLIMIINLFSPDGRYDQLYLSNYATIQVIDELARIDGVGDARVFGQQDYSMRVWLDPDRLTARRMTVGDVLGALREQNVQVAAGQLGQPPAAQGVNFQYTMTTLGRLTDPEQFADIIVKTDGRGRITRLRDISRVELGARNQNMKIYVDEYPAAGLAVAQLPGANALSTADAVKAKMAELKQRFPEGLDYCIHYDTTPYIRESIDEVFKTLLDAVILVSIVVLVFLQNWRSALIPLIAVPVAIIGTFAAMAALGFSINTLSLFGLVLAIGIVVDDAIVVVEATEHHIERGLSPRAAAHKAMAEVSWALVAIGLVLSSVFLPCVFITGITGLFFRQFALTIAVSTLLSAMNSLTLSPALCAILLKPRHAQQDPLARGINLLLGWFFKLFNRFFAVSISGYAWLVGRALRMSFLVLVLYAGLVWLTGWSFGRMPTGFIPPQDQGYLFAAIQLPDSASLERTDATVEQVYKILRQTPGVAHVLRTCGMSYVLGINGSNMGNVFVILKPFEERRTPDLRADAIAATLRRRFADEIQTANVAVLAPPPMRGLGTGGGFKIMLQDRGNDGLPALQAQADELVRQGNQTPGLTGLFTAFRANTPQLYVDVDRTKCKAMGVPLDEVFQALQVQLGGAYVNDINLFGRTWQVNVQADTRYRMNLDDVRRLQIRNLRGDMVPLGTLAKLEDRGGPFSVIRYNMYPAAAVQGSAAPGRSTGQTIEAVSALAGQILPAGMAFEWTEISYLQLIARNTTLFVFSGAVLLVFLVLAGQYESWSLPLAVILVVPMCILCSVAGVALVGLDINIFTQIGFVVLVGLASKNAILIVEFAKAKHEAGMSRYEATVEACRLRLRPIMMTSFAFILGVVPLVLSSGAGAEMRRTLGTAVFSGMLGVTFFGIFLTPVFYYSIQWLADRRRHRAAAALPAEVGPLRIDVSSE